MADTASRSQVLVARIAVTAIAAFNDGAKWRYNQEELK